MKRTPEPELMDSEDQARAYAEADFSEANTLFEQQFLERLPQAGRGGRLVDLGCGPADICVRLGSRLAGWSITGLDAGPNMLKHAQAAVDRAGLQAKVELRLAHLPDHSLEARAFQAVVSNSLLHHLPDPTILWTTIRQVGAPGATVQVMDLSRPASEADAAAIVERHAAGAPRVLQEDFYNSLLAAYTPAEVEQQLQDCGLDGFEILQPSDRHWLVAGQLPE